jgi:mannitol-1-phosphate/altronate dehydrogenase
MLLTRSLLPKLPAEIAPLHDTNQSKVGWVHFGPGKFFQAHVADYLHGAQNARAHDGRTTNYGILVVKPTERDPHFEEDLRAQGGLYTHIRRTSAGDESYVNAAIKGVLNLARESSAVVNAFTGIEKIRGVTLTITQAGYRLNSTMDGVDLKDTLIQHDIANPWKPVTVVGALAAGLVQRANASLPLPLLIPCDNMPGNGTKLGMVLESYMDAAFSRELAARARGEFVTLNTMVDRIVPDKDPVGTLRTLATRYGFADACATVCDPHARFVVQEPENGRDQLLRGLEPLVQAGMEIVKDVRPFEDAKIRGLNGAHMAIGLTGTLLGQELVHETLVRPPVLRFITHMMDSVAESVPTITNKPGFTATILQRLGNQGLPDKVSRLIIQTASKVSQRLVNYPAINEGRGYEASAMAVAVWLHALRGTDVRGNQMTIADEPTEKLREAARGHDFKPDTFLLNAGPKVFDPDKIDADKKGNVGLFLRQVTHNLKAIEDHSLMGALDRAFPDRSQPVAVRTVNPPPSQPTNKLVT